MNHEEQARKNHKSGFNCAQSVFVAFAEELGVSPVEAMQMAPKPRSEGGKCGAYLAGQALLRRLKPEAAEAFEKAFVEANGVSQAGGLPRQAAQELQRLRGRRGADAGRGITGLRLSEYVPMREAG